MSTMALLPMIPFLLLLAFSNASTLRPTITSRPTLLERDEFAIVPTSSGQIGINPVESDLGDPNIYNGEVFGTDTSYLALTTTTTAWIGVNTEYLTMESSSTIQYIVATATAAANGQGVGDISILLGEGLAQDLQSAANDLISACGALAAKKRLLRREIEYRQTTEAMTCLLEGAAEPAGRVFEAYPNGGPGLPALEVAADASEVLSSGLAGYSGEQLAQIIVLMSFVSWIVGTGLNSESTGEPQDMGTMGKVNIPALGFGAPPASLGCTGNEELTANSPICLDADCLGDAAQLCTVENQKKNCPCLLIIPEGPYQQQNASFFDMQQQWLIDVNNTAEPASCNGTAAPSSALNFTSVAPGTPVKSGTELRILPVGDSITVGYLSDQDGGDGNGYRLRLLEDLSADSVNYAGTVTSAVGTMTNGFFAAWSGQTIQYIADNIGPSLPQRPNIVLIHAGTNDMNPDGSISVQGDDPTAAAGRLGSLIDQVIEACPDATILVAMIINPTSSAGQEANTLQYQALIPGIVAERQANCSHVIAVDFTTFPTSMLRDGIHPTNAGYQLFGDYWYDFITQIPQDWINAPIGNDTNGPPGNGSSGADSSDNGGIDTDIPAPDWTASPVQVSSHAAISSAAAAASQGGRASCDANPVYSGTGEIALGLGQNGAWQYQKAWVSMGEIATGLGLDPRYVRLSDMNGDGKADYVWLDPETGEVTCWLNNLPDNYSPAGTNGGIIASGAGAAETVFLADLNGDGLADYLVVHPDDGSVDVYWNYGPDDSWANGWKFVPAGQIASGVPHANLETLRFPDINGDGRADYVVIGEGGSLEMWLNTGSPGGQDVLFLAQGGIATGATSNISNLVFADMDGDGRDDYLIWDSDGGLTGFLNQRTLDEGVPIFIDQGPAKTIAGGVSQSPSSLILADIDGDGIDDYVYVDNNGALFYWRNNGGDADTTMAMDGLRFADIDGDGIDDYVWLDPVTGAPTVYLNSGVSASDSLGWAWSPLNGGLPIASGAAPAAQVMFGDIDGDGKDDYLVLDPVTGALSAYLNSGADTSSDLGWSWNPIGQIATGLGPGKNVRFADIDGDGFDDYIFLHPNGGTTIYKNKYDPSTPLTDWEALPDADASGIGQRPEEIDFVDINGDGKADYVWTRLYDGAAFLWTNNYPNSPTWVSQGQIAGGVGTSGACVRYATLQDTGRSSYAAVNPDNGAIGGWLNGCANPISTEPNIGNITCQGGTNWITSSQWSDAQTQFCDKVGGKNAPTTTVDYTYGSVIAELSLIWQVDCEQVPVVVSTATCNSVLKSISEACPLNAGIGGGSATLVECYSFNAELS